MDWDHMVAIGLVPHRPASREERRAEKKAEKAQRQAQATDHALAGAQARIAELQAAAARRHPGLCPPASKDGYTSLNPTPN